MTGAAPALQSGSAIHIATCRAACYLVTTLQLRTTARLLPARVS
jgi:hypothetical protein